MAKIQPSPHHLLLTRMCDGTTSSFSMAIGIMSSASHKTQRMAVRASWLSDSNEVLGCFLVGAQLKQTPVAPWNKKRAEQDALPVPPRGQLSPLPQAAELAAEHERLGDVLVLNGSVEIAQGGTSGLKTLPWWRHAASRMPGAAWVGKCDDDTFVHVPPLLARLPPRHQTAANGPRARALLGTIKWGCYSNRRFKFERSCGHCKCGTSEFAKSRAPTEPADLHKTYEGPYRFALGWFYAMPFALNARLASCECAAPRNSRAQFAAQLWRNSAAQFSDGLSMPHRRYADWFHRTATGATAEPFLRKEDDPLNGHWLHKCLLPDAVEPLSSLGHEAHNMACISQHGLYRRPSNESIVVHFLKTPGAMQYVRAVLARGRRGEDAHKRTCCTRMVWPTERRRFPASVCDGVMPPGVDGDGVTVEDGWSGKEG